MTTSTQRTTSLFVGDGVLAHLSALRDTAARHFRKNRAYRATYAQLDAMSDRDLADIGITRFMIADVAHDAAARA